MATKPMPGMPWREDEATVHLAAFVDAFVVEAHRSRARLILVEKPRRRRAEMKQVEEWLDPGRCRPYVRRHEVGGRHDDPTGVYVRGHAVEDVRTMRLSEAIGCDGEDAIFSVRPGTLAFWLSHEGDIYECSSPDGRD